MTQIGYSQGSISWCSEAITGYVPKWFKDANNAATCLQTPINSLLRRRELGKLQTSLEIRKYFLVICTYISSQSAWGDTIKFRFEMITVTNETKEQLNDTWKPALQKKGIKVKYCMWHDSFTSFVIYQKMCYVDVLLAIIFYFYVIYEGFFKLKISIN